MAGKRTWEMQSQTCPVTELHSSLQNFGSRSLKGAQPSYFSPNFWAIKEELQEHLKLPQVSIECGQTTQFTDFYYNLDISTAYYCSNFVVTAPPILCCILYLQTGLCFSGTQVQPLELFHWELKLGKSKSTLLRPQQTEIFYIYIYIYEDSVQLLSRV